MSCVLLFFIKKIVVVFAILLYGPNFNRRIPLFNGSNYGTWKIQTEAILQEGRLLKFLVGGEENKPNMKNAYRNSECTMNWRWMFARKLLYIAQIGIKYSKNSKKLQSGSTKFAHIFKKHMTANPGLVERLTLVYTDLCGPMRIKSVGEKLYFATYIDDYSRKVFAFCIHNKSEELFRQFKKSVELKEKSKASVVITRQN